MPKKIPGLDWLDEKNEEQLRWAIKYLREKGIVLRSTVQVFRSLLSVGKDLELTSDGREILSSMKNAWRQKNSRAPTNGKKATSFTLKLTTKKTLVRLARAQNVSATAFIETLIENAAMQSRPAAAQRESHFGRTDSSKQTPLAAVESPPARHQSKQTVSAALALLPPFSGGTRLKNNVQNPSKTALTASTQKVAIDPDETIQLPEKPEACDPAGFQNFELSEMAALKGCQRKLVQAPSAAFLKRLETLASSLGPEPEGLIPFESE